MYGTHSRFDSLIHLGTLLLFGSLMFSGTLSHHDSLNSVGAITFFDSLVIDVTFSLLGFGWFFAIGILGITENALGILHIPNSSTVFTTHLRQDVVHTQIVVVKHLATIGAVSDMLTKYHDSLLFYDTHYFSDSLL